MTVSIVLILLGAPGSGKGTIAQYLKDKYDICYFSTGNLLRNEIQKGTDVGLKVKNIVGVGGLVDDETVNEIVKNNIEETNGKVIILDGYPRTQNQALILDKMMSGKLSDKIHVVELDIDHEEIISRLSSRRVCEKCGNTYGAINDIKVCHCGGNLIKRKDDEESTIRNRLSEYEKTTLLVSKYYSDRLIKISGKGDPKEVGQKVEKILRDLGVERRR